MQCISKKYWVQFPNIPSNILRQSSGKRKKRKKVVENDVSTAWFGTAGREAIFMSKHHMVIAGLAVAARWLAVAGWSEGYCTWHALAVGGWLARPNIKDQRKCDGSMRNIQSRQLTILQLLEHGRPARGPKTAFEKSILWSFMLGVGCVAIWGLGMKVDPVRLFQTKLLIYDFE